MELIVARRRRWSAALPGQTGSGGRVGRWAWLLAYRSRTLAIRSGRVQAFRLPAIAEAPTSRSSCAEVAKIANAEGDVSMLLEEGPAQRIVASGRSLLHVGRPLVSDRTSREARSRSAGAMRRESAAGQSAGLRRAHRSRSVTTPVRRRRRSASCAAPSLRDRGAIQSRRVAR